MSNELFSVDVSQMEALAKLYQRMPKTFGKATGEMLNKFAFGTRVEAFYQIASRMTLRNNRFVSSRLQVTKSAKALPVANQQSIMGSVATARFSGWTEQQLGSPTARTRVVHLLARLGNFQRQVAPKARLKPNINFLDYNDIRLKGDNSAERRSIALMQMLARARSNAPFMLTHKQGMKPGLYRMKRGKPMLLQSFEKKQPHRIPWLTDARARYFRDTNIEQLWAKTFRYLLKGERLR